MCPDVLKSQVESLKAAGQDIETVEHEAQCYVIVRGITVPSPPWESTVCDVLIAIPAAYDDAALDGFYLALPYKYGGGEHKRVNGRKMALLNRDWQMVSWHYPDGKPWLSGRDSLETHITHCRGFFLHRGAVNDPN